MSIEDANKTFADAKAGVKVYTFTYPALQQTQEKMKKNENGKWKGEKKWEKMRKSEKKWEKMRKWK